MDPKKTNVVETPANRLQGEQTTTLTEGADGTTTPPNSYSIEEKKAKGSLLKQEAAASVIANGKGGELLGGEAVMAMQRNLRPGQYTGDSTGYLGSAAGTPTAEKPYQGGSRVDKKLSDANKEINFRASEQYATEFQHVPYLRESKSTVGANGNPQNVAARSQKKSGLVPQGLLFDRSLDEARHDSFIATAGQTVREEGVSYQDYPVKFEKKGANGAYILTDMSEEQQDQFKRGNFSPRYIKASFKKSGQNAFLSGFEVVEDDFSISTDYETLNDSADNFKVALNRSEVARQLIDNKHGSPEMEHYSPLGRSVMTGPSRTVMYLRDVESTTGAICSSALRFANKARAYFLSRTAKDGQLNVAPGLDALYGHLVNSNDISAITEALHISGAPDASDSPFDSNLGCAAGSAFTLVKIFDSVSKYNTKGDLVNQPRGLKFALQTGMNNHMPLRVEENFLAALNAVDVFSTIDRDYDPSSVVCIEDGIRYILPYSWNHRLKFTRETLGGPRVYAEDDILFAYGYQAGEGNQRYVIKVGEPVLNGIAWFLEQHASKIFKAVRSANNAEDAIWYIPVVSYSTRFSLWDLLVSASMAYIDYERTNSLKDLLDLEVWGSYPFADFKLLSKDDILTPTNYGKIDELKELSVGKMKPTTAMRWVFPELFSCIPDGSGKFGALLPWYENERNYDFTKQDHLRRNDRHNFTTPVIRSGVRLKSLDDFFSMEAIDQLFAIDKLSAYPFGRDEFKAYVYKYDLQSDGLVAVSSDVFSEWTAADIMKCPRQLGWLFPAFASQCRNALALGNFSENGIELYEENKMFTSDAKAYVGSAYSVRMYKGVGATPVDTIFEPSSQTVDRGQAFSQDWYDHSAQYAFQPDANFDVMLGFSNALNANLTAIEKVTGFAPFLRNKPTIVDGVLTVDNAAYSGHKMFSISRAIWARIQKLPFILSPFDNQEATNGYVDPYDFAYMFGLAGFIAANYDEELQNRESIAMAEQFGYTNSYYLGKSVLYK